MEPFNFVVRQRGPRLAGRDPGFVVLLQGTFSTLFSVPFLFARFFGGEEGGRWGKRCLDFLVGSFKWWWLNNKGWWTFNWDKITICPRFSGRRLWLMGKEEYTFGASCIEEIRLDWTQIGFRFSGRKGRRRMESLAANKENHFTKHRILHSLEKLFPCFAICQFWSKYYTLQPTNTSSN